MLRWTLIILLFLTSFGASAQKECTCQLEKLEDASLSDLAGEYHRLRKLRDAKCDYWGSDLQKVMEQLGVRIASDQLTTAEVERMLGPPQPDRLSRYGAAPEGALVYMWRNRDELWLIVKDDKVVKQRWWYPLE